MHLPTPFTLALAALALSACAAEAPVAAPVEGAAHAHASSVHSPAVQRDLAALRRATAPFHRFERAVEAGYAAAITPCWEHRTDGAMGYHYGKEALIDGTVSLLEPELLMYEPQPGGHMRLVGMEYIVPIDAWTGDAPPTLLGQAFHPHSTLPIYKLHVWLWRDNPRGVFADWNPAVSCAHAAETETFD
jgi:hypothetical protein